MKCYETLDIDLKIVIVKNIYKIDHVLGITIHNDLGNNAT